MKTSRFNLRLCVQGTLATLVLSGITLALPAPVFAADEEEKQPPRNTRVTSTIRLALQKKLAEAQKLAEEKKFTEALEVLNDSLEDTSKPSQFEQFQLRNFIGYVYYQMGNYDRSLAQYQQIVKFNEVDNRFIEDTYFTISQLYHLLGRTEDALKVALRLEKIKADKSDSTLYVLISQYYYQLEQYQKGLPYIKRGISLVKNNKPKVSTEGEQLTEEDIRKLTTPRKSWYQLWHAYLQQLRKYKELLAVDMEWVYHYPENDTLMYLAGSLAAMGRNKDQLSVLELLYDREFLDRESYIKTLAQLEVLHGIPYKAALMLEKAMADGVVDDDKVENLVLLSRAWVEAKEDAKSIPPLKKAAQLSESGREYDLLAKRYVNLYKWQDAENSLHKAFKKGGLGNEIGSRILLGQAQGESNKFRESIKTFEQTISTINKKLPAARARLSSALKVSAKKRDNDKVKAYRREVRSLERQLKSAKNLSSYMENQIQRLAYLTSGRP